MFNLTFVLLSPGASNRSLEITCLLTSFFSSKMFCIVDWEKPSECADVQSVSRIMIMGPEGVREGKDAAVGDKAFMKAGKQQWSGTIHSVWSKLSK